MSDLKCCGNCAFFHQAEKKHKTETAFSIDMEDSIDVLGLNVRIRNCLKRINVFKIKHLLLISPRQLLAQRNFGELSLYTLVEILAKHRLTLRDQPPLGWEPRSSLRSNFCSRNVPQGELQHVFWPYVKPDDFCSGWQPESWRQITKQNTDADGSAESHVS